MQTEDIIRIKRQHEPQHDQQIVKNEERVSLRDIYASISGVIILVGMMTSDLLVGLIKIFKRK